VTTNKLIIQSIVQAGLSPAAAAERYGVSRRWVYELLRRYREGGDDALNAMSRRPRSNPRTTPEDIAERIRQLRQALTGQGLDSGAATIAWHLEKEKLTPPSLTTIHRILRQGGLVTDQPHKRPRSSWHRFEAAQPNETWQSDFTHWRLENRTEFEVLNFLDDHSRYLISCTPHPRVTGEIVLNQFLTAGNEHGFPASTLTDNGMVFTTRYSGGRGGLNGFEKALQTLGIQQKNGSPNHPQTQGRSNASTRHRKPGSAPTTPRPTCRNSPQNSTGSGSTTTTKDPTARTTIAPRHRPTRQSSKHHRRTSPPASTTASASTRSTTTAKRPSATPANSDTSASDETTTENASSCSSKTPTSPSSK
jgi:transposase